MGIRDDDEEERGDDQKQDQDMSGIQEQVGDDDQLPRISVGVSELDVSGSAVNGDEESDEEPEEVGRYAVAKSRTVDEDGSDESETGDDKENRRVAVAVSKIRIDDSDEDVDMNESASAKKKKKKETP